MAIELITWGTSEVTPMDDAIVRDAGIGASGILYGCGVTASGNVLTVAAGYGLIKGRLFQITETELTVTLSSGSDLYGRIYIQLDLSNTDTPVSILTDTNSTETYTLTQEDDANYTDGIYEISLATFTVTTSEISGLTEDYTALGYNRVSDLYYQSGERVTFGVSTGGYITNGNTTVVGTIPLNRSLSNVSSVTLYNAQIKVRQNSTYIIGSGSAYSTLSGYTVSFILRNNLIEFSITSSSGLGTTNNSPCAIAGVIVLTFS